MKAMEAAVEGKRRGDRHGPLASTIFSLKVSLLRAKRALENVFARIPRAERRADLHWPYLVERRSLLRTTDDPRERRLELGKIQNLRLLSSLLDGLVVESDNVFSFWKQVGRCTSRRGFVLGRQIQEGCVIPAIGGGICQISNALYALALELGFEIVERHPHTVQVARATRGPDATVAFNHIDLRFRSGKPFQIHVRLTDSELIVGISTPESKPQKILLNMVNQGVRANSCETCGADSCHRHSTVDRAPVGSRTAYLIEEWMPEFATCLPCSSTNALLLVASRAPNQVWAEGKFEEARAGLVPSLRRSWRLRFCRSGGERQRALLKSSREFAQLFAKNLPIDCEHLVISQSLLPHLWQIGALGGRTYDVLMTRLPIDALQGKLDEAAKLHPERELLSDFRAPADLVEAERQALAGARTCFTAHAEIARQLPNVTMILWSAPSPVVWKQGKTVVFPGPTVARKGAFEVREACQHMKLTVATLGAELEGDNFWAAVKHEKRERSGDWLNGALAVVQPAILEDKPYALLAALEAGCPVICTEACGLPDCENLYLIPAANSGAIVTLLQELLRKQE